MTLCTKISFEHITLHKALRIINFKNNEYNVNELYKTNKILKIADFFKLLNCLFVRDVIYM